MTARRLLGWLWTILTGLGMLSAVRNLREVVLDNWALSNSPQRGIAVLKLQTRSAIWDHALIFAALACEFGAGLFSLGNRRIGATLSLIACAIVLTTLSFTQTQRRRRLFDVLRLRRPAKNGGS